MITILYGKLEMNLTNIHSLLVQISGKIDKIEDVVDNLNDKLCKVEEQMDTIKKIQNQPQTQVAMVTTISTSEEKIKLLNQQTSAETQEDIITAIREKCLISDSGVLSILDQSLTIYEHIATIIYELDNDSSCKYIYGFSDSKTSLYYWNHNKKTWAKLTKSNLYEIFMEIQKKIIFKYNELMKQNVSLKSGCVENGDLIFANDYEKRHGDFKKSLISMFT
jgi:hypothetical protein